MQTRWRPLDVVQFALGGSNIVVGIMFVLDSPNGFLTLLLGVFMCLMPLSRRHAYNHGWLRGRACMVFALEESAQRGHSLQEWLIAEAERDMAALPASYRRRYQEP